MRAGRMAAVRWKIWAIPVEGTKKTRHPDNGSIEVTLVLIAAPKYRRGNLPQTPAKFEPKKNQLVGYIPHKSRKI